VYNGFWQDRCRNHSATCASSGELIYGLPGHRQPNGPRLYSRLIKNQFRTYDFTHFSLPEGAPSSTPLAAAKIPPSAVVSGQALAAPRLDLSRLLFHQHPLGNWRGSVLRDIRPLLRGSKISIAAASMVDKPSRRGFAAQCPHNADGRGGPRITRWHFQASRQLRHHRRPWPWLQVPSSSTDYLQCP